MSSSKFVGVMGSELIGTDPYNVHAWSGISRHFFGECTAQGILQRAFGVEVNQLLRRALMLRSFSPDRTRWRRRFYLDTTYYEQLTRKIARSFTDQDRGCDVLQIGGIYRLRPLLEPRCSLYSYHDGNLAQALRSPEFARGISRRRIDRALAYERSVYESIDLIFTMSDYLRNSFVEDFGVPEGRVRTIGAGVNLERLPEVAADRTYDNKRLLFIGAAFARKGGQHLLEAFRRMRLAHPTAELYIVGPRSLSIPAGLSAGVVYLGFLSKHDPAQRTRLEQLLTTSSLFVMPSLYEPFGIAPLEAMAYGIPAVLTDAWAFPEMVRPGVNGELVKLGDAADLAEKLIELLRDPERLHRMGAAGRELVAARFTWPAVVGRLREQLAGRNAVVADHSARTATKDGRQANA
jgi:glycosyltransferase involved in cell wall biosynthesis